MKRNKVLALLSIACCATTLFAVGCSNDAAQARPQSPVTTVADSKYTNEDFLAFKYMQDWKYYSSTANSIAKKYGTYEDHTDSLILFKKTDKDVMNNVVETYNVYNINTKSIVYTYEFKYEDIDDGAEDKYGNEQFPEKMSRVSIEEDGCFEFIQVVMVEYEKLDDKLIEEEKLTQSYMPKSASINVYDVNGKRISSVKDNPMLVNASDEELVTQLAWQDGMFGKTYKYLVGDMIVITDKDGKILDSFKASKQVAPSLYTYKNNKYGYFYPTEMGSGGMDYIEVYELSTGKLVYRYSFDMMQQAACSVLENGNMYIQLMETTMDPNADVFVEEEGYGMNITALYVNFANGSVQSSTPEYIFEGIYSRSQMEALMGTEFLSEDFAYEIGDKFVNMGAGIKLEDFAAMYTDDDAEDKMAYVFLDNNMKVMHTIAMEGIDVPGVDAMDFFAAEILSTGDKLVDIETPLYDDNGEEINKAIVTADGKLRTYLTSEMQVVDDYILIPEKGIFDFDMNCQLSFDTPAWSGWTVVDTIGDNVLMVQTSQTWYQGGAYNSDNYTYEYQEYYYYKNYRVIGKTSAGFNYVSLNESYSNAAVVSVFDDLFWIEDTADEPRWAETYQYFNGYGKDRTVIYNLEAQKLIEVDTAQSDYDLLESENGLVIIVENNANDEVKIVEFALENARDNYLAGISEDLDRWADYDKDGIPDEVEKEIYDRFGEGFTDNNKNGLPDEFENEISNDLGAEIWQDNDGNGIIDFFEKHW